MKQIDKWLPAALLLFAGIVCVLYGIFMIPAAETGTYSEKPLQPVSVQAEELVTGVSLRAYASGKNTFPDSLDGCAPALEKYVTAVSALLLPEELSTDGYAEYAAYFHAKDAGEYTFTLSVKGGARLFLNEEKLIEQVSPEADTAGSRCVWLEQGYYTLRVCAFGGGEPMALSLRYRIGEGEERSTAERLYRLRDADSAEPPARLNALSFLSGINPSLGADVSCAIDVQAHRITALLPPGQRLDKLTANFEAAGRVYLNGEELISGVTEADFSHEGELRVVSGSSERVFTVHVRALQTGLPCVCINSFGGEEITSKWEYVKASVTILGNGASYGAGLPPTNIDVKIRGNYSSGLEKKPYMLKFGEHTAVLDLTAEKSWVLVASHIDLSLMRNYTAYETARHFDAIGYTPRMRFVDVFVNGDYRGNYLLGDHVEISSTKLALNDRTLDADVGCVFELEKDFRAEGVKGYDYFQTPQGWCVTFKDPNASKLTAEQRAYLASYFIQAENAIMSGAGYEEYIDVDSFIDWFLIETLFKNCDSDFTSSIYFHKDAGGKLKMGPVWDFDSGLANHSSNPEWMKPEGWEPRWGTYFEALMKDPAFRRRMSARWAEMKPLAVDTYAQLVDSTVALIERSFKENFKVYSILETGIWPVPENISSRKSIQGQAQFMKTWIARRAAWLDAEFQKEEY